jgi:hypothetical protein
MTVWLVTLMLFFGPSSWGEYRAFELRIDDPQKGSSRTVISVLDHLQYRDYYSVATNEAIALVGTWRCRGNTSNYRPICPKPAAE